MTSPPLPLADPPQTIALLTTAQAASLLGYRPRMLEARRAKGGGPQFVRISKRSIRYRLEDVQNWIFERLKTTTRDI